MTIWKAIILGIIQGLTEFLPVSSSGHLAIAQQLLKVPEERILFFATMLHFGTLISIFLVYGEDIMILFREFFRMLQEMVTGKGIRFNNVHRKMGLYIILATIPTGLIGILFNDFFEMLFGKGTYIGFALILTGTLLWFAEKWASGKKNIHTMSGLDAVVIGLFQAFAITPGISRSGSTLVGSLFMGLSKELAVKFVFLISIPPILGATLLELKDAIRFGLTDVSIPLTLIGILTAALSGFIAIKAMINFIRRQKLHYFSYYTWVVGAVVVAVNLLHS